MSDLPPSQRVFPFRLASWLPTCYETYLYWLRHLLERLGYARTLSVWQSVYQDYDDELLLQILSGGWQEADWSEAPDVERSITELIQKVFPQIIEGISPGKARRLVEAMPPIHQIRELFPALNVCKESTAYEALHLRFDALALLSEALIDSYGKQGELIAYEVLRQTRLQGMRGAKGSAAEFITGFTSPPREPNLFSAGLETEVIRHSLDEVVVYVRVCEWARYFHERHPRVGYLMACSTDDLSYRAFNEHLRLQRTTTLMEGGELCDFRIYTVGEEPDLA